MIPRQYLSKGDIEMIFRTFFGGLLLFASQGAYAATVGGYEIDPTKAVGSFSTPVAGAGASFSTNSGPNYTTLYAFGNSWGGIYVQSVEGGVYSGRRLNFNGVTGNDVHIRANFTAPIVNQAGIDFYVFESGDANANPAPNGDTDYVAVSLTGLAGSWVDMTLLSFLPSTTLGAPVGTPPFGVYVYGIDFSSLGVAPGATLASLFFGNSTTNVAGVRDPDIVYGAAAALAAETPVPAALPLFATGLGALGLLAYRRRRKQAA
jgi:hypothetical protein